MDSNKMEQLVQLLKELGLSFDTKGETVTVTVPHERVFIDNIEKSVVEHCEKNKIAYSFREDVENGVRLHHYDFEEGIFSDDWHKHTGSGPDLRALKEEAELRQEVARMENMYLSGLLNSEDVALLKLKAMDLPKQLLQVVEVREIW